MKEKMKYKVNETFTTGKRIIENAEHFVLATALVICAAYNYYDLTIRTVGNVEYSVRVAAAVVIGLKGAWEVMSFFSKYKK